MYQSDWLLRQIELLGDLFRRIVAAIREHDPDTALELCDEAIGELLDLEVPLVDSLDGPSLALLIGADADGSRKALALAEVLGARMEAHRIAGRHTEAMHERDRARALLEVAIRDLDGPPLERAKALADALATGGRTTTESRSSRLRSE